MRRKIILLFALAVGVTLAANAELVIRLKNGLEYRLPISADELHSAVFSNGVALRAGSAPAPDAAAAAPIATAAAGSSGAGVMADPAAGPRSAPSAPGAAVLRVGPGRALATPSAAARVAGDGAVVEIDAATYRGDVAVWNQDDLTLRGVGGRPRLLSDGVVANDKAIWVVNGDRTLIENIEFAGARVADRNGAGIRLQGTTMTIRGSYFHHNDMGILTGADLNSELVIENSEFAYNHLIGDRGDFQPGHNIYVGKIFRFVLRNSYIHDASEGHNVKSRATENYLLFNRIGDGERFASYAVDLSAGGLGYLIGNVIHQGKEPDNYTLVSFAAENKGVSDGQRLHLINNTLVNDHRSGAFVYNHSANPAVMINNLLVGRGRTAQGPVQESHNLQTDAPRFVDRAGGDYRLTAASPAIDRGIPPGASERGEKLAPRAEYRFPEPLAARPLVDALDLGAFEYRSAAAADQTDAADAADAGDPAAVIGATDPAAGSTRPAAGRAADTLAAPPNNDHSLAALSAASAPGPHVEAIEKLGDNAWLSLGRPTPDPVWGSARGRSWSSSMPYAASLNGAFLFGEGVHAWVNEDTGRMMDDFWFYDAAAHRWVAIYPGTSVIAPPRFTLDDGGFTAIDGRLQPVASMVHGYTLTAWSPRHRLFAAMPNPGQYWRDALPQLAELIDSQSGRVNRDAASPWFYQPERGRWLRARSNPSPVAKFGDTLIYIGASGEFLFRQRDQIWFYNLGTNSWRNAGASGAPPPFGIEATAAYDPKRNRVYFGGGLYPEPPLDKTLWVYDVAANAWRDPQPQGNPGGPVYNTASAMLHYDHGADELLVFRYNTQDGQGERGIFSYAPTQNRWRKVGELPAEWEEKGANGSNSGFYHVGMNAHFLILAGDSRDNARVLVYRYRRRS